MATIGIVGAGVAGAGAAYALRETSHEVVLLEESDRVGGRTATRTQHGCAYDHGANYVKEGDGGTGDLVRDLGEDGLVDVEEPVWTIDHDGSIQPGDREEEHKYTWESGISQFAERLLDRTDAEVRTGTRVASLERTAGTSGTVGTDAWTATDRDGEAHGPFDALVLTPPAPVTADLLEATEWPGGDTDDTLPALREAAEDVPFRTVRTVVLNYEFELDVPWYGLVDVDREHGVRWLSREECKRGHVPDGQTLLVAQMSPDWSTDREDLPLEAAADEVADRVASLLDDERLTGYDWADDHLWRDALPEEGVDLDQDTVARARDAHLFLAGDWVVGEAEGRVHEAVADGVDVGGLVAERL